jgi:hypothetical protein
VRASGPARADAGVLADETGALADWASIAVASASALPASSLLAGSAVSARSIAAARAATVAGSFVRAEAGVLADGASAAASSASALMASPLLAASAISARSIAASRAATVAGSVVRAEAGVLADEAATVAGSVVRAEAGVLADEAGALAGGASIVSDSASVLPASSLPAEGAVSVSVLPASSLPAGGAVLGRALLRPQAGVLADGASMAVAPVSVLADGASMAVAPVSALLASPPLARIAGSASPPLARIPGSASPPFARITGSALPPLARIAGSAASIAATRAATVARSSSGTRGLVAGGPSGVSAGVVETIIGGSSAPHARDAPPLLQFEDLPPRSIAMLCAASDEIFGIPSPRPFQYVAAHHCIYNDDTVLVVPRRTADGKTLVAQLSGFFRGGVILYQEPLFGLATDQVERATATEHNLEGYHGDEHKHEDQRLLIERLMSFNSDGEEAKHVVINLLIGPKLTTSNTWRPVLESIARRGLIQMIVIDEVHYIRQSASFRPEFATMMKVLARLPAIMPRPCPRLLLSATMTPADVDQCKVIFGGMRPNILHGPLDRRRILFKTVVTGNVASSLRYSARCALKSGPGDQQI